MSAQRRLRRRLAKRDGQMLDGGCPCCDATTEVVAASPGYHVHHDDGCVVLDGDRRMRHLSNRAAAQLLHPGERVLVVTELPDGQVLVATIGGVS